MYELYFLTILASFALPFFVTPWLTAGIAVMLGAMVLHGKYRGGQGDWTYVNQEYTKAALCALLVGSIVAFVASNL